MGAAMIWSQTFTGRAVDILAPDPASLVIEDIAHALARINRFTGQHLGEHYSVAQHSVLVSHLCDPDDAFEGLMHDAAEAYLGDVASPVKLAMRQIADERGGMSRSPYDILEQRMERAIATRFGLRWPWPASVKRADLVMLATEARDLMHEPPIDWRLPYAPASFGVRAVGASTAEREFLRRFEQLAGSRAPEPLADVIARSLANLANDADTNAASDS
ncbi:MAG: metal-dependent phosphohydrolase [Polyangiales bacterium]